MTDPMLEIKDRLLLAALPNIPFEGWTKAVLAQTAHEIGLDRSMGERAFPGGPVEAVLHFIDLADRRLQEQAGEAGLDGLGLTARVKGLVRMRIDGWIEHREAIRRAVSLLSLPGNVVKAAQATWRTSDLIWHLAGDHPVDFSYYTKRATLSAVYSTTLLTWLSDESDDRAVTWSFLDRRIADLGKVPKVMKKVRAGAASFGRPFEQLFVAMGSGRARRRV